MRDVNNRAGREGGFGDRYRGSQWGTIMTFAKNSTFSNTSF